MSITLALTNLNYYHKELIENKIEIKNSETGEIFVSVYWLRALLIMIFLCFF
jgi:hypothetical protein